METMHRFASFKSRALRTVLAALVGGGLALGVAQQEPATPATPGATPTTPAQPGMGMGTQDVTLPPGVDPDETLAELGEGMTLTQHEFAQQFDRAIRGLAMQHGLQFTDQTREMFDRFRAEFLEMYATQQALLREAETRGIEVTDIEVDQQIAHARGEWGPQFDQVLGDLGYADEAQYRDAVREGLIAQRVVDELRADVEWTDEDLAEYHEMHRARFFGDREFDEVRGQVEQRFLGEQLQQRFTDLRAQYGIEVFPDRLAEGPAGLGTN
jgi:hypothetical protein